MKHLTCKDCPHCIRSEYGDWLCAHDPNNVEKLFDFTLCHAFVDLTKKET